MPRHQQDDNSLSVTVSGSIADLAARNNQSLAESFMSVDHIVLIDVSGSMSINDVLRNGQVMDRYNAACYELEILQKKLPGKLGIIAFSTNPMFIPGGRPPFLRGGTDLCGALKYVAIADGVVDSFTVISDGLPDSEADALSEATKLKTKINTIYIGPEGDDDGGQGFLARLAKASGGKHVTTIINELAAQTANMLSAGR